MAAAPEDQVPVIRESVSENPNSLHEFHKFKRGPQGVPDKVINLATDWTQKSAKHPGHSFATTSHISFKFFDQGINNAPFGYEHFVSLPPTYEDDGSREWPLMVFLHGAGESQRGPGESYASIRHGISKIILSYDQWKSVSEKEECVQSTAPSINIPVAPRLQRRKNKLGKTSDRSSEPVPLTVCSLLAESFVIVTPSLNMNNGYGWSSAILHALIDEILERYRVDENRIHLTGFSMGGYGTFDSAMYRNDRFASIMPICGGGDTARARELKHIPCWIHHGMVDDIIPAEASQQMYDALLEAGAQDVRYSKYPGVGHDSWTAAYNDVEVYQWMLRCRKPKTAPNAGNSSTL